MPPAGLGSAANVRPGFYQQLNAPRVHPRRGGPPAVVPVYVYVEPPRAPAPAPQPIYVVRPSEAAPVPQPTAPLPQPTAPVPQPTAPVPQSAPVPAAPVTPPPKPRSTEPGAVAFSIHPADAQVYLDDDYLGTGAEIAADTGHRFAPGVHVLEVTHPEFRSQRLVFGVQSEEEKHVVIDLATDRVGRRSRIK